MKVLKNVLLVVGLIAVIAAGAMLLNNIWNLKTIFELAYVNKSQASLTNPIPLVALGAGLALVGGILLGLGIGMPRRTAGSVRKDAIEDLHRKTAAEGDTNFDANRA